MKFSINRIEQLIPDEVLEKAEMLLANLSVESLREVEKNLWTTTVFDPPANFEVELQISGQKVVAYSCDCAHYGPKELCVHLTASLLKLRKRLSQKAVEKEKKRKAQAAPKRLTTNMILQKISAKELTEFVRSYAKTNRPLALALKARFASSITGIDREEKYHQLLLTSIKSVQRNGRRIPQSGLQQLLPVVDELKDQCQETIGRQDFKEAFAILQALFEHLPLAIRLMDGNNILLLYSLEACLSLLHELLSARLAPTLEAEIWEFSRGLFQDRYLAHYQIDRQFLTVIMDFVNEPLRAQKLLETIDTVLANTSDRETYEVELILAQLDLLDILGQESQLEELLHSHLHEIPILLKAISIAEEKGQTQRMQQLIQMGLSQNLDADTRHQFYKQLLQIAIDQKDKTNILKLAKTLFLSSYEDQYWQLLKKHSRAAWPKHKASIIQALNSQSFSVPKRDALANIYATEKETDALFQFLQNTRSLDLLMAYDQSLLPEHTALIYDLYRELLWEYIQQHLGRQSSIKVKKVLQHLKSTGAGDFVRQLLELLRQEYSFRHSLIEELEGF